MPIRVIHVTSVTTSNYYLDNLGDHVDPREVSFTYATLGGRGGFTEGGERRGFKCYAFGCRGRVGYPRAIRELCRTIGSEGIDIVHVHLFEPSILGLIAASRTGCHSVLTRHHSDAIHRIPNRLKRAAYLATERWINQSSDHIIAPSVRVREILVEQEGVPPEKVSIIPYGQTRERFDVVTPSVVQETRSSLGMTDRVSLVCVSRLYEQKGHQFLFAAFSELIQAGVDAELFLVGEGHHRRQLEDQARRLRIDGRVRFLGWRDDALAVMAAADVVVHPSLEDALPSAVIEALMLEKPLVVTNVSGVADTVGASEHGLVVPQGDARALREALAATLADLPAARERARKGRAFVLQYMDAARVARDYTRCYKKVAGRLTTNNSSASWGCS